MNARRVVEYLVVAGIVERKDSEASITSELELKFMIVLRCLMNFNLPYFYYIYYLCIYITGGRSA